MASSYPQDDALLRSRVRVFRHGQAGCGVREFIGEARQAFLHALVVAKTDVRVGRSNARNVPLITRDGRFEKDATIA